MYIHIKYSETMYDGVAASAGRVERLLRISVTLKL